MYFRYFLLSILILFPSDAQLIRASRREPQKRHILIPLQPIGKIHIFIVRSCGSEFVLVEIHHKINNIPLCHCDVSVLSIQSICASIRADAHGTGVIVSFEVPFVFRVDCPDANVAAVHLLDLDFPFVDPDTHDVFSENSGGLVRAFLLYGRVIVGELDVSAGFGRVVTELGNTI